MPAIVRSTWRSLVGVFLTGVMAILPLAITVGVVVWVAGFLEGIIGPDTFLGARLRSFGLMFASDTVIAYLFGWILVLVAIFLLGVVVRLGAQNLWERVVDLAIKRIPILGGVYQTAQQLVDMLKKKDPSELQGMSAVFCVFSKENSAGLLALMPSPERFRINGQDYHVVIIPTAPVPVGGALLFVPAKFVHPADISVEGLMNIYVSMGVTLPKYMQAEGKTNSP